MSQILKLAAFCIILFFACNNWAKAQFTPNAAEFAKQITAQYSQVTMREDMRAELDELIANIGSGRVSDDKLQQIVAQCNDMQSRKMRNVPHFSDYYLTINGFIKSGNFDKKFNEWQIIVKDITTRLEKSKTGNLEKFLDFSRSFFNGYILYDSPGKSWGVQTADYTFKNDEGKPSVSFTNARLLGYAPKDTIYIQNTSGTYFPFDAKWQASGGRITWDKVLLDPNTVYADLPAYNVDMTRAEFVVPNATFYHKKLFSTGIKGVITDKLSARVEGEFIYPQFESDDLGLTLKNLCPNSEFKSGFAIRGNDVYSYGTNEKPAQLTFYDDKGKTRLLSARAKGFKVKNNNQIVSMNTSASIYFAGDSIYHPRVNLHYNATTRELRLVRESNASSRIAFMSSFHKFEANVDAVEWTLGKPVVDFKMTSELKNLRVVFESYDMYDQDRMRSYNAISQHDPISKLADYANNGQFDVPAGDYAAYLNSNFKRGEDILNLLFRLVEDGFIYYYTETDMIHVREKAQHYDLSRRKKKDFDRIALISEGETQNAQLDFSNNNELIVTGVKSIGLSDSQRVVIYPTKGIVRAQKNRDMDVNGTVVAGSVDLAGKNFGFKYDPFFIKMDTVAQMQVYVDTRNKRFEHITPVDGVLAPISTLIQNARGNLYIDEANNKSGREKYPSYPRFESTGNAYLYYNSKKLYNGAYKADTFHFKLNPFNFEDLDEIQPENLVFPGTMITGNIFPPFEQTTTLQDDLSLGFVKNTPASGMPTYKKGNFSGTLSMSNKGLIGEGMIEYMAAKITAKDFIFLPDSMMTEADSFHQDRKIVKGIEFPSAHNGKVRIKWLPSGDSMLVYMKTRPFLMFEDKVSLKGNLLVTDKGLKGAGTMNWSEASIRSDEFFYTSGTFKADSSDVSIKNKDAAKVAFDSYNVKSRVDMDKYLGEFLANGPSIPINLPYNQYKTNASEFYWLMNDKLINIRMPEDENLAYFTSTHPDQGNLKFKASGAVVNLAENTVKVDGIPYITVADAKIRPADTQVFIDRDAQIRTLEKALIVADSTNEYHKITDATINIKSANEFSGKGEYKYRGKNMKKQSIFFDNITTKEDEEKAGRWYTVASTVMPEEQGFKLNNNINFKGDIFLDSRQKFLIYDGFAKLDLQSKDVIDMQWFKFKDQIDPENIQIDVSVPIGEHADTLSFGLAQDMHNLDLYPTFLTKKRTPLDKFVFRATGDLASNNENNTYRVGTVERLEGKVEQGNVFTLQDAQGKVQANGKFTMGEAWGAVDVAMAGQGEHDTKTGVFEFKNMVLGLGFMFDKKLWAMVADGVRSFNSEAQQIDYTSGDNFYKSAVQLVEKGYIGDLKGMMSRQGYMSERIKGLNQDLIIANLNMVWDTSLRTFVSKGRFGLAFCGEQYVNRMVDGFVEFGIRQTGDFLNIYIETDKNAEGKKQWYYFTYKKGQMQVVSSEMPFVQAIVDTPEKKRLKEDKATGSIYTYGLCPMLKRNQFLSVMRGDQFNEAPEGQPMLNPDGTPIINPTLPTNPDGTPITNPEGQPMLNPDGTPMLNPDGTPMTNPDQTPPTTNPDGTPIEPKGDDK
jgi:hypothetical protein